VCVKTAAGLQLTNNRTTCHSAISGIYGCSLSGPSSRVQQSRRNTALSLKMGPECCPETSTTTYQPTLPNFPEERPQLHRSGSKVSVPWRQWVTVYWEQNAADIRATILKKVAEVRLHGVMPNFVWGYVAATWAAELQTGRLRGLWYTIWHERGATHKGDTVCLRKDQGAV